MSGRKSKRGKGRDVRARPSNQLLSSFLPLARTLVANAIHCIFRVTNSDGRASAFLSWADFDVGVYKMHFNVAEYFRRQGVASFYPYVEVRFEA